MKTFIFTALFSCMFLVVMAQTNDTLPSQQEPLRTQNSIYVTGGTLDL